MSDAAFEKSDGFRVKGRHVLIAMITFFGVIFSVNAVFITTALNTFPGEEVRRSYMQGLAYNEVIAARRAQAELGWSATVNALDGRVLVAVEDAEGQPVMGLRLNGVLRRPTTDGYDRPLAFTEARPGVYAADHGAALEGRWILAAEAEGDTPFVLERELWRR